MKIRVIKNFRDKYNNNRYKEDEELEITEERFEEINSTSFGILVEKIEENTKEDEKTEEENKELESKVDDKKKSTKK